MELDDIVSVSGLSGLYKLIAQKSDGVVIQSLETKETKFASSRLHKLSTLKGIGIYLENDDQIELFDVFKEMMKQEVMNPPVDVKSNTEEKVRSYFKTIITLYDPEKVHFSDIRKVILWYQVLKAQNLII